MEFPPYWDNQDLIDLFEQFGEIHITWINDTSAFVALKTVENLNKGFLFFYILILIILTIL